MGQTHQHMHFGGVGTVRVESPFKELETVAVLNNHGAESISHPDSLFLTIFDGCGFVPIERDEVRVDCVHAIDETDPDDPHTERAVTVNGVFLEIPVHFILDWVRKGVL